MTCFNANYYGALLYFALLGGAYLLSGRHKKAKVWYGLSMVLNVVGILLTASRSLAALVVRNHHTVFFINRRLVLWLGDWVNRGLCQFLPGTLGALHLFPSLIA